MVTRHLDKNAFYVRQPPLKLWHMALIGTLIAAAIFFSMNSYNETLRSFVIIIISLSIIGLLYILQNSGQDNRTANEFQLLVFTGAMRIGTMLTLVLHKDGSIFYLDPRYAQDFSNGSPYHNLDQFLTTMGVENANKIHIYDAIRDLTPAEFEYVYKEGRKSAPLKIGIHPLARPDGFVVLTVS